MIDTHCHLLPGIDDGACTQEETLDMCRLALDDGIHTIVATPHAFDGLYVNHMENVRQLCATVNELLAHEDIGITVLPGMELRVAMDSFRLLLQGSLPTLNDHTYLLMEFPPTQLPNAFDVLVKKAVAGGCGIILAHPEKNLAIQSDPEYVFRLLTLFKPWDVLVQVTADSMTGRCGRQAARTARILLENNMAHILASDAHDRKNRPPMLSSAVEVVEKLVGSIKAEQMVAAVPKAVIGHGAFPDYPQPQRPRRWWRIR